MRRKGSENVDESWKIARWVKGKHRRGKMMPEFGRAEEGVRQKGSPYTDSREEEGERVRADY